MTAAPDPRTQDIQVFWVATVRYHEARLKILSALEDEDLLDAFHVTEAQVGVRFARTRELLVDATGLRLADLGGVLDDRQTESVLDLVLDLVRPQVREVTNVFRHLVPVDSELGLDDACLASTRRLFPGLSTSSRAHDYAVLMDGRAAGRDDLSWQAEFGLIDAQQAPLRMTRLLSAFPGESEGPQHDRLHYFTRQEYPDLSVFVESRWRWRGSMDQGGKQVGDVLRLCREARRSADDLAGELYAQVAPSGQVSQGGGRDE